MKLFQRICLLLAALFFGAFAWGSESANSAIDKTLYQEDTNRTSVGKLSSEEPMDASNKLAYVIPIRDQIGPPVLDILRRGMKTALEENASIVILDMETPGGELGVTLEIMQ